MLYEVITANVISSNRDSEQVIMARYGLALLAGQDTNFSEAVRQLEQVILKYPDKNILQVDLASLYLDNGEATLALPLLRKAYKRDPTDMYATYQLARALEKNGEVQKAERLYKEVVKVMPEYSQLYYALGRIKANQGAQSVSNFYLAKYYLYEGRMNFV